MRRLSALFITTLILTLPALGVLHIRNSQGTALSIAMSLTLLAWSIPLLRLLRDNICRGSLNLGALDNVSTTVKWTYEFVFAAAVSFTLSVLSDGIRGETVGDLSELLIKAAVFAWATHIGFRFLAIVYQ
jgi:hypothetical protein